MPIPFSRHCVVFEDVAAAKSYLDGLLEQRSKSDRRIEAIERAYSTWEAEREELERMIDQMKLCLAAPQQNPSPDVRDG